MSKKKILKSFEAFNSKDELDNLDSYLKGYPKNRIELDDIIFKIKSLNLTDWNFDFKGYGSVLVYPSSRFLELTKEANIKLLNDFFLINVDINNFNRIDFEKGIPAELRGIGLAYKIYKVVINHYGFITSDKNSSIEAQNIWYNLMLDKDLLCYTSNIISGVILKTLDNERIKNILEYLKGKEVIFDDELKEKIKEIYGSMDIYK
jgi:hypothetical protein